MRFLALLILSFGCAASWLRAEMPPAHAVPVVLKIDDLRTNDSGYLSDRWKRLLPLLREHKTLKLSIGIIANSLEGDNAAYFSWIKEMHDTGRVEFWLHGYDHKEWEEGGQKFYEFKGPSYEQQKEHLAKSQALAKAKLGFVFTAFGAPFNCIDDNTIKILNEDADMKVVLYANLSDQSKMPGKTILDRVFPVNIEQPLFVPNPEKFIAGYNKFAGKRSFFVAQGHGNKWDDARWPEFLKIVDFLEQNKIPTVLPTELAASLSVANNSKNKPSTP